MATPPHHASECALRDAALDQLAASRPGDPSGPAVCQLVAWLAPVIQARVLRQLVLHRTGGTVGDLGAVTEEFVQLIFGKLFEREGRVLRVWSEEGGMSLRNWVGRFTVLRMRDVLRCQSRDPWREEAREIDPCHLREVRTPEDEVAVRRRWALVREQVLEGLSDRGRSLFALIIEDQASTDEVREATGLSADAVFQWRSRLRRALRTTWQALEPAPA